MQRDGCFRGSSIMLKEKITFRAPFSCNWHRRLRAPAVDELQERVDKRKTGKHARSPAVKKHPVATKGLKTYSKGSEALGVEKGRGEQWRSFDNLFSVEAVRLESIYV